MGWLDHINSAEFNCTLLYARFTVTKGFGHEPCSYNERDSRDLMGVDELFDGTPMVEKTTLRYRSTSNLER